MDKETFRLSLWNSNCRPFPSHSPNCALHIEAVPTPCPYGYIHCRSEVGKEESLVGSGCASTVGSRQLGRLLQELHHK